MKIVLYSFLFIILLASCDKESHKRIKFRVVSKTTVDIAYSVHGKWFYETQEAGDWSKSYRVKRAEYFNLSAFKSGPFFDASVMVYFDGELYAKATTDEIGDLIELEGTIP